MEACNLQPLERSTENYILFLNVCRSEYNHVSHWKFWIC